MNNKDSNSKSISYQQIGEAISKKQFTAKDLEITSRQFNYWKEKDVIPFFIKDRKTLMTLPEALWVLIINELSNIGIVTTKLQSLSSKIWIEPLFSNYADDVIKKAIKDPKGEFSQDDKEWFKFLLEDEIAMHHIFRREITPYMDSIKSCLRSPKQIASFIYCPNTEEYRISSFTNSIGSDLNNLFYGETLITIPYIPHLIRLMGIEMNCTTEDLKYLTEIENQIWRSVQFEKPKLLQISLDEGGNNKIYKITESHKKSEELAKFFLNTNLPIGSSIQIEKRSQGNYKVTIKS